MVDVVEVTVADDGTSDAVERDFTTEEKAQRKADEDAAKQADAEAEADRQAKAAARAALLSRLGITEAEAQLLSEAL